MSEAAMEVEGAAAAAAGAPVGESRALAAERAVTERFEGFVASGIYVTLHIDDVPLQVGLHYPQLAVVRAVCVNHGYTQAYERATQSGKPLVAFSLLRYENKISVLHFNIQKCVSANQGRPLPLQSVT
jgi:hypothetical protein